MNETPKVRFQPIQQKSSLLDRDINGYIDSLLQNRDKPVLVEMERLAKERSFPIVGRQAGAFLEIVTRMIQAKRIFELGSGFGYSAYWFCKGMHPEGRIICTDGDRSNADLARDFLGKAGFWKQVEYHVGWAQEVFKKSEGSFDIIYNDVNKNDYPEVWQMAKERLHPGGLYIADNAFWHGRVTREVVADDTQPGYTEGVQQHNQLIAKDPAFRFFINPTRDGLIVAYRLQ